MIKFTDRFGVEQTLALNNLYCVDCMDVLRLLPDKAFELAIVDPPYGGGANAARGGRFDRYAPPPPIRDWSKLKRGRFGGRFDKYKITRTGGTWSKKYQDSENDIRHWDVEPTREYFEELFRVSKNQIIWGGNYFDLPPSRNFIIWSKGIPEKFSMSMCEYAWTNIVGNAKIFEFPTQGNINYKRFHPTQKPVELYQFLLNNYARPGDKILDTHAGSASSLVACHGAGFDYVGFELDKDYYRMASERLKTAQMQTDLFNDCENNEYKQITLF